MAFSIQRAARYGFCSGVRVADIKVRRFVSTGGRGAILGQVVHNERVVEELERLGVRTVESLDEVTEPVVVFSAHGVPPSVHRQARERGLEVLDTTCQFVYDIHRASQLALARGSHLVFVGNPDHREVIGYSQDLDPGSYHIVHTVSEALAVDWGRYEHITVFYQTTLNAAEYEEVVRAIEAANPRTERADTICYATRENQEAARQLAAREDIDLVLVIGGKHSANTRHLYEICSRLKPSQLIQGAEDIDPAWLSGVRGVGLSAGASTPDYVMDEVETRLAELGGERL